MTAQQRWTNRTAAKHFHVPRELRDFDFTVQFSFQAGKQNFALTGFETVDDVRNASQIRLHRHDDVFLVHEIRVRHFIDVEIHMGAVLVPIDPNFTFFLLKHMSIMLDTSTSPTGSAERVVKGIKLRSKLEKYSFASVRSDVPNPERRKK